MGFCVGLFADVYIHIEEDEDDNDHELVELDPHRFTIAIPCPICEEESSEQLFDVLCGQLDRYSIPDYWIRKLRDSLFEDYVTPTTCSHNCRRLSTSRSPSRIRVLIRGFMDEIARLPNDDTSNPEDVERQQPAAPDAVQALQQVAAADVEGSCSICLEAETPRESDYLKTPCSHILHRECLLVWLSRDHTCPYCRYEMPVQTP